MTTWREEGDWFQESEQIADRELIRIQASALAFSDFAGQGRQVELDKHVAPKACGDFVPQNGSAYSLQCVLFAP